MFNPYGYTAYNLLQPSARRKEDPGWGWAILLGVAALTTAAGVLFGPLCAGVVFVLAVLALIAWRLRRGRAATRVSRPTSN